jgi:23S rRNA (cytidine1920-2'-O)/16S rRNA (cytidine1409-2'-O)-methyltransferase
MKQRLDKILLDKGYAETRSKALGLIMSGHILVNGKPVTKAGASIEESSVITLKNHMPYVSRGALKLEAALESFQVDVKDMTAIDVGASTGGFTEIMILKGASKVYAVDVGHGQLHWKLRTDPRIICLEGINARLFTRDLIPEQCDIATFDVSFISLKLVIPPIMNILKKKASIIALIKPQFEAGKELVGKGGIVRNQKVIDDVINDISTFLDGLSLKVQGVIPSPIKGTKGNQEYLIHALKGFSS